MTDAERRGPTPARFLASSLPLGSAEQIRLVQDRIRKGVCLECGGKLEEGRAGFCGTCLAQYPIVENISEPCDGWQYRVRQLKPAYMGEFYAERVDAFPPERGNKSELLCIRDSKAEAVEYCEKRVARHMKEVEW